jgi:hypothetical protein
MSTVKKLTNAQKFVVIKRLASFDGLTEIAIGLKDEFGVDVTPQAIIYYDPLKNPALPKTLADMFYNERAKFLRDLDSQPMQSTAFRQNERHKMFRASENNKRFKRELLNDASTDAFKHQGREDKMGAGKKGPEDGRPPLPATREEREKRINEILGNARAKAKSTSTGKGAA